MAMAAVALVILAAHESTTAWIWPAGLAHWLTRRFQGGLRNWVIRTVMISAFATLKSAPTGIGIGCSTWSRLLRKVTRFLVTRLSASHSPSTVDIRALQSMCILRL